MYLLYVIWTLANEDFYAPHLEEGGLRFTLVSLSENFVYHIPLKVFEVER